MKLKIALVFGTRPEIIKLSPLIRLFEKKRIPYFMIHSGQHYSYEMDRLFFKELDLPEPKYRLGIRSRGVTLQADHTGRMLIAIERILLKEMPDVVLVQGDTNTVLAGALTVSKFLTTQEYTHIRMHIGHVEAGLRSYDRRMPEEINRVIADHLSDYLFVPTPLSKKILLGEKVPADRIHVTGNTIVDAVYQNLALARKKSKALQKFGLKPKKYILMTMHRQENVDNEKRLRNAFKAAAGVIADTGLDILFPMHPRTVKKIQKFGLKLPARIRVVDPVGFLDFLRLEAEARLILTDSGGLQEEGMILKVPCVTLRETTERPETVQCGANILAGVDPKKVRKAVHKMLSKKPAWPCVLGDGRASEKILSVLKRKMR